MKRRLFRKGQVVEVEFLDHVEGGEEPLKFVVYGRIQRVDRKSITVICWGYTDDTALDSNNNYFTIIRSTIINWYKLNREQL